MNLQERQQSILLLNRRGFSSIYLCRDCGEPVRCRHCHVSLTYHKKAAILVCHYCGYVLQQNILCGSCRSDQLIPVGFGTERIEHEIADLFPEARVARIDSDTATDRRKFISLLRKMHQREIDILIGTQMIAKGHDFPHVTLVGVVWADGDSICRTIVRPSVLISFCRRSQGGLAEGIVLEGLLSRLCVRNTMLSSLPRPMTMSSFTKERWLYERILFSSISAVDKFENFRHEGG